jgi:hypothetical protein
MTDTSPAAVEILATELPDTQWQAPRLHRAADTLRALSAQLDAANQRSDASYAKGKAEGLREAANALRMEYNISNMWVNGLEVFGSDTATPAACYKTILALIPASPAEPAQTVQECTECRRRIAWHISNLNERAIAGGKDE